MHIPLYRTLQMCRELWQASRCGAGDFPVVAVGSALQQPEVRHRLQDYVDLLITDLRTASVAAGMAVLSLWCSLSIGVTSHNRCRHHRLFGAMQ